MRLHTSPAALRRLVRDLAPGVVADTMRTTPRLYSGNLEPRRAGRSIPLRRMERIEHRRRLAYAGPLPPSLEAKFSVAEAAVLKVIGDEIRDHGRCDRCIGEIAARAAVSRTSAQNAIRKAIRLGLIARQERRRPGLPSLTNVLTCTSEEWGLWLSRRPKRIPVPHRQPHHVGGLNGVRAKGNGDDDEMPAVGRWGGRWFDTPHPQASWALFRGGTDE